MHATNKIKHLAILAALAIVAGCVTTSSPPGMLIADEALRDTDKDLLFGTELPVTSKEEAISRADEARKAADLSRALYFYVKALEYDPEDAELLAAIVLLHLEQGNDKLAARAYTLALQVNPDYVNVLEARGLILLKHDENERAVIDLARAAELNPDSWRAHNGLGLLASRQNDYKQAITHYNRALAIRPESADILNNRGYARLLADDNVGAEYDLRRATELGHDQAWVNLGTLFARNGQYERAVKAYSEALPEPEAFNKVAEASINNGDYDTAQRLLEQAIFLSPVYFPAAEANLAQLAERSRNESG